jgi:hypothetical protein
LQIFSPTKRITGAAVLGGWLPTWLTVTEAPTVAVVCLTCNIVHMKEIFKRKITNKNGVVI